MTTSDRDGWGVMDNTEVFFGIMRALGIDATKNVK